MDGLGLTGTVGDVLGVIAGRREVAELPEGLPPSLVSELHDDHVAGLDQDSPFLPQCFIKASGAGAPERAVDDIEPSADRN